MLKNLLQRNFFIGKGIEQHLLETKGKFPVTEPEIKIDIN